MTRSSKNHFIAGVVRWSSLALFIAISLRTMGIANEIVQLAFGLILGAIAVAVALSYGLGGREAAGEHFKDIIQKFRNEAAILKILIRTILMCEQNLQDPLEVREHKILPAASGPTLQTPETRIDRRQVEIVTTLQWIESPTLTEETGEGIQIKMVPREPARMIL